MQVTIEGGLFAEPSGEVVFYRIRDAHYDPTFLCNHTIVADIPADKDPRAIAVAELNRRLTVAAAEYQKLVTDTQRQINELLAISMEQS